MCDCRQRIESMLQEDLPAQLPAGHQNLNVRLQGYALLMGEGSMR